ncbi:MAG: hypothetical protein MUD14_19790 [Hydrococcus sp. Prado102]|nr:hypothetical protein [Hydrococcus sp. Prado102]
MARSGVGSFAFVETLDRDRTQELVVRLNGANWVGLNLRTDPRLPKLLLLGLTESPRAVTVVPAVSILSPSSLIFLEAFSSLSW